MAIVDLTLFKAHLRMGSATDEDTILAVYLAQGEAMCLDYVRQMVGTDADEIQAWYDTVDSWSASPPPADIPLHVSAAILRMATNLYRFRGDDTDRPTVELGELPRDVTSLLNRLRDPALA